MTEISARYEHLQNILQDMQEVLIAFSGGTDSTFLLKAARDVLGDKVMAVTALSETMPEHEKADADVFAQELKVKHVFINSNELEDPDFIKNPLDKCYICKKIKFGGLVRMAESKNIAWVADGENIDDAKDYRPGSLAARELGIRSPLREAGLTKSDIRLLSKELELPTWNKPAYACLASRIPYHQPITAEKLRQIDKAEAFIRKLNLSFQVRVRHEGDTARIEAGNEDIGRFTEHNVRNSIVSYLKSLGFKFIALDLEGYSTGSLNRVISSKKEEK
ncbi:Pyridinium-3,5-bisthiocarboxylic acid mononucleotide synthase [Desulfonema limicola]|uniref:Pyridinium-3,5-bisthiocarboxylic acid mononucleotide synthase n=1 Tax=Desulfonema limicola TaxID=45656 RepID=A0A975BA67_9BACT|nr:ATP-dependent sacrificial sulfur transferase LarE [Desulfonema limicola]QTA81410.1 Pyridinium-3,5-bisthiocarboxylic acid mononucleotide synthase [Desulfonema limicola]